MSIGNLGNVAGGYFNGGSSSSNPEPTNKSQLGPEKGSEWWYANTVPSDLDTSQPTNPIVAPSVIDYSHFVNSDGRTTKQATWSDAPVYNTAVIAVNTQKAGFNMLGNGINALNPYNW
jgi:hypothetical protein